MAGLNSSLRRVFKSHPAGRLELFTQAQVCLFVVKYGENVIKPEILFEIAMNKGLYPFKY